MDQADLNNSAQTPTSFDTRKEKRRNDKWINLWIWELGACTGSLLTFSAIAGLLFAYDGRSQPEWPYGITLNSALSWLSTITKSLLLLPAAECISQCVWISYTAGPQKLGTIATFDAASRGPWGSLKLLWSLKASQVACLGALLTILAIGIDPTMQQTLVVRTRMRATMEDAYIARSQSYLVRDLTEKVITYSLDLYPTPGMMGAMYSGLFLSDNDASGMKSSLNVFPSCPTGNCTYPVFTSLAVRSQCNDISEQITKSCSYYDIVEPVTAKNAQVCQFKTPSGTSINQTLPTRDEDWDEFYVRRMITSNQQAIQELEEGARDNFAHGRFFSFQVLRGNTTKNSMDFDAFECTLSWCLNQYNATVVNGQLSETVVEGLSSERNRLIVEEDLPNIYFLMTLPGYPNFTVSAMAEGGVVAWLQKSLQFSNSFVLAKSPDKSKPMGYNWSPQLEDRYTNTLFLQDSTRLFLQQHPSDIMKRLAKAMTTYIRSQSTADQTFFDNGEASAQDTSMVGPVKGTAYVLEIYVAVRWWWLSLAGCVLILTLAFFGYIASVSERRKVPVWKSSPLALLFHGLTVDLNEGLRTVEGMHEMEERSMSILVQLQNQGQAVGFELKE